MTKIEETDAEGGVKPVASVIVATPSGDIENPASTPDRRFRDAWMLEGDALVLDPELMKPLAKQKVTEWRETQIHAPIEVDGVTYAADPQSIALIDRATQLAEKVEAFGQAFETEWSDIDGGAVPMDRQKIDKLGVALGLRTGHLHVQARGIKAAIDASTTAEEIIGILAGIGA